MASCDLIPTDSGGIQEEAPTLGKPTLVLRETTERPEVIEAGLAKLVGVDPSVIVKHDADLLDDTTAYAAMVAAGTPYGDGKAAARIAAQLQGGA